MNDTPEHIKQLQLKIWLSKTPAERLMQFLNDNEAFFKLIKDMKDARETRKSNEKNAIKF
ncbi:MAG: hypothetical protein ABI405_09970 [Parafilimonas sp.]